MWNIRRDTIIAPAQQNRFLSVSGKSPPSRPCGRVFDRWGEGQSFFGASAVSNSFRHLAASFFLSQAL
jgi:hypothetical protein